jgi:hypothetical protein
MLARQELYQLKYFMSTFCVGYFFEIVSCFMLWLHWTKIFLFVLSCLSVMTVTCHYIQPFVEMGSHQLLPQLICWKESYFIMLIYLWKNQYWIRFLKEFEKKKNEVFQSGIGGSLSALFHFIVLDNVCDTLILTFQESSTI